MATKKEEATPTPEDLGIPLEPIKENPDLENEGESAAPPEGPAPKRRGRPAGSNARKTSDSPKKSSSRKADDINGLAHQIQGIHQLIAMATGLPELIIGEQESAMLAKGITAVTEEYGFALSGKTGAAFQLFGAAAIVYVPRLMLIKAKAAAIKKEQEKEAESTLDGAGLVNHANVSTH